MTARAAVPAARRTDVVDTSSPRPTSSSTGDLTTPLVGTVATWPALPVNPRVASRGLSFLP